MNYLALEQCFASHEENRYGHGQPLTAIIVFNEIAYPRTTEEGRSCLISSDSPAFQPFKEGNEIMGCFLTNLDNPRYVDVSDIIRDPDQVQDCIILEKMRDADVLCRFWPDDPMFEKVERGGYYILDFHFGHTDIRAHVSLTAQGSILFAPVMGKQTVCGETTVLSLSDLFGYCILLQREANKSYFKRRTEASVEVSTVVTLPKYTPLIPEVVDLLRAEESTHSLHLNLAPVSDGWFIFLDDAARRILSQSDAAELSHLQKMIRYAEKFGATILHIQTDPTPSISYRPMTKQEYACTGQRALENLSDGLIARVTGRMDRHGELEVDWRLTDTDLATDEFRLNATAVWKALQTDQSIGAPMKGCAELEAFCQPANLVALRIGGNFFPEYAMRINHGEYTYLVRINDATAACNATMICFEREWLDRQLNPAGL